jgi:arylsulfatase A-like enzyme
MLNGKETPTHGWIDDITTGYAIQFLDHQKNVGEPFFLWLGFKSPHGPRGGESLPERARGLYAGKESRGVPNLDVPAIFETDKAPPASNQQRQNKQYEGHRAYMRHITMIDECVGRVLDALDKNGQSGNTVVIVSSDNGYYLGEHMLSDKRSAYDESMRVPLIIHLPGADAKHGVNKDAMVLNIDYGPTILDFAGAEPLPEMQGRSLRPLLTDATPNDWRTAFFYEYFKEPKYASPTVLAVRTNTSKLIIYPGHDEWTETFDLKNDPFELKNLNGDKALLKKLRAEFDAQAAAVKFHMPKLPNEKKADKKGSHSPAVDGG